MATEETLFHNGVDSILMGSFHSFFIELSVNVSILFFATKSYFEGYREKSGDFFVFLFVEVKNEGEIKKKHNRRFSLKKCISIQM
ncbi:hypothetical protein [Enterococcus innesii]|uniref:hypothetical protein n=1 Tax=Enterococcus innesii TaxID=2839759 RepID=UPI0034A35399